MQIKKKKGKEVNIILHLIPMSEICLFKCYIWIDIQQYIKHCHIPKMSILLHSIDITQNWDWKISLHV